MTMEPTLPQETRSSAPQENSAAPDAQGPRPKQGFRRRRKRRGSGGPGGPGPNPAAQQNAQNASPGEAPANNAPRNDNQPRKQKKRFFKKNKNHSQGQNPGNNKPQMHSQPRGDNRGNLQQPPRRGNKQQRRAKVFVGPMDHSYRAVNGNFADAPPSTIELQRGYGNGHFSGNGGNHHHGNGNFNGNFNVDPAASFNVARPGESMEAPGSYIAPPENAPARIYCFIDDLFFVAKIQETARKLGIKVAFVKNEKDTVTDLLALPDEQRPALIVIDLNNANAKPLTLIPKLKLKLKRSTSIIGFLSHLQGELKVKAQEAGCDTVMPRSAFSQNLPNLLRRYGLEVDTEAEDSQAHILEA